MRLWHPRLLPLLPDRFVIAQWREVVAIKRQWEKGILKHRLVSYVMDYERYMFFKYTADVVTEMKRRHIKYKPNLVMEFVYWLQKYYKVTPPSELIDPYPEHNDRYLKQCYYNLQEKYDRGIVSKEEWELIHKNIYGLIKE